MSDRDAAPPQETRFDYWRRRIGLAAGPILGLLVFWLVQPTDLSFEAKSLAAVLTLTIIWWICEPIPLAATALLSPLLCVLVGVGDVKKVFAPFASSILFLFIGTFILAEAAGKHGLDRRFAMRVLGFPSVSRSPTTLLLAVGGVAGFISMWTSNTATTALIAPVVLGMIRANPQFAQPRVAAALLLMVSFAATAGGLATPVGTPPNLIAIGFIQELLGRRVSFVEWMRIGVPLAAVLIAILTFLLRPRGTGRFDNHEEMSGEFRRQAKALGPMSVGERNVVIAFVGALFCWIYPGVAEAIGGPDAFLVRWFKTSFPEDMVGLALGLSLFLLPINLRKWEFTVTWRDASRIEWGTILLFGGGMALGQLIFSTGLATAASEAVLKPLGQPGLWTLMFGGIMISIALSEGASNTASANVMVPLMIGLAQGANLAPVPIAIATSLACSFGFMLPVSTAPNAIVYGTGRVPLRTMLVAGGLFDVIGACAILGAMWFLS